MMHSSMKLKSLRRHLKPYIHCSGAYLHKNQTNWALQVCRSAHSKSFGYADFVSQSHSTVSAALQHRAALGVVFAHRYKA